MARTEITEDHVKSLQSFLLKKGFYCKDAPSGVIGKTTAYAYKQFLLSKGVGFPACENFPSVLEGFDDEILSYIKITEQVASLNNETVDLSLERQNKQLDDTDTHLENNPDNKDSLPSPDTNTDQHVIDVTVKTPIVNPEKSDKGSIQKLVDKLPKLGKSGKKDGKK